MPKNIEDIIIPEKNTRKSIRNIPIPDNRPKSETPRPGYADRIVIHRNVETTESSRVKDNASKNSSRKTLWIAGTVGVVIIVFALLSLFRSATLTYTPKSIELSFNKDSFTAYKAGGEKDLMFSMIKLSGTKGLEAKASGEEKVSIKSSGKAIVYNNASTLIKLIHNTRFETPDNKIYRILVDISVPAKTDTTPGSLEVNLYADQPGPEYNIALTDFTVPGLKGDPRYTTVYARSKTTMTGGFIGVQKQVSDADLKKAKSVLETSLKEELMAQAKAQVPADFILYPGLVSMNYVDLPQTSPKTDSVTLNVSADFYGVMFKRNNLNSYLAEKKASQGITGNVEIMNLESLTATLQKQTTQDFLKADQISFELTGTTTAVSVISEENLKKDLAGTSKSDLGTILLKYKDIENASVSLKPVWKTSFPTNPNEIKIVKTLLNK